MLNDIGAAAGQLERQEDVTHVVVDGGIITKEESDPVWTVAAANSI
jgi:hypothetical protein